MNENPLNSMKEILNINQNENTQKNDKKIKKIPFKRGQKRNNPNNKISPKNSKISNNVKNVPTTPYQREISEVDKVFIDHTRKIENEIVKLIQDIQYLDSKNPVVDSEIKKILVELINNVWIMGNTVKTFQEENDLSFVNQLLSKYEKIYMDKIDSGGGKNYTKELKNIITCKNLINESSRTINSTIEYYNVLISKLSNWGLEVKNPTGQKYDVHMDIDLLTWEDPDPNLDVPMITETRKPEIYLNGNKLSKAQVIVTKAGSKKINSKIKKIKRNLKGEENDSKL